MNHSFTSPKTLRLLSVVVFLSIIPPFVKYAWWETWDYVGGDFEIFLQATTDLSEGKSPYPVHVLEAGPGEAMGKAWGNYIYPPLFAKLLTPFSFLPPVWAKKAYLIICLVIYLWMFRPTAWDRSLDHYNTWLIYALILGWGPVIHTFRHGQSDFIPLFLTLFAIRIAQSPAHPILKNGTGEFISGCLIGIGSMIKITPILFLPVLVMARHGKAVVGFIVGACGALFFAGPLTSWQYFTQVLPNMADFSGMRQCPSIHIVLVRLLDTLPVSQSWQASWPKVAEWIGVAATGALFLAVLIFLTIKRKQIRFDNLLMLICFLPPLFAGEVAHHYALALIPVVAASHRLLVGAMDKDNSASAGWSRNQLILLLIGILPNFYYWEVIKFPIEKILPFDLSVWLVVGNLIAFLAVIPVFVGDNGIQNAKRGDQSEFEEYYGLPGVHPET